MIPYHPTQFYSIFGLRISPEVLAMDLAFIIFAVYLYFSLSRAKDEKDGGFMKLAVSVLLAAVIGGRIFYFIQNWHGLSTLRDFFMLSAGSISIGMVVGGAAGLIAYILISRRPKGRPFVENLGGLADSVVLAAALAVFVYRLFGCFIYGLCTKGTETLLVWGLEWPGESVLRHPTPLYMAVSALTIFILLRVFFGHKKTAQGMYGKSFDGEAALWFVLLYCTGRFFIDFLRVQRHFAQYLCVPIALFAAWWLLTQYTAMHLFRLRTHKESMSLTSSNSDVRMMYIGVVWWYILSSVLPRSFFRKVLHASTRKVRKVMPARGFFGTILFLAKKRVKVMP